MKQQIIDLAIENLSAASELMVETTPIKEPTTKTHDGQLRFYYNGKSFELPYAVKRKISNAQLPFLQDKLARKGVVIFEYASKPLKAQLRKLQINYLEVSGNAHIINDDFYLFLDTNQRVKLENNTSNAAFSKTGLKVIYQFLVDRARLNNSYRALGKKAGVSIDTIGRVYKELVRDKYLVKVEDRKYALLEEQRLFQDWVTLFNKTLRPKLKQRTFSFKTNQPIQQLLTKELTGKIGGELAAEQLSNYNIAENASIYVSGSLVEVALQLNLRPDKNGNITIIEQFWEDDPATSNQLVGLPLIYADLVMNLTPRNLETAKYLLNEYLQ